MQIVEANAQVVDVGQGFMWGGRREMSVLGVHVNLVSDDGTRANALAWPAELPAASVVSAFNAAVKPLLIGADPNERAAVLAPAWRAFRVGMPFAVLGVADTALWDLAARGAGRSVSDLLGRCHSRLKACASAPPVATTDDAALMTQEILGEGFRALKLHSCGDLEADIAVCEVVREVAGDSVDLMMDVMAIYDRRTALALGQVLDDLNFRWYEDPLPDTDLDGWRELRGAITTPVAGVDSVRFTVNEYARPIAEGAFDVVRMDAARNGISQLNALAKLADGFGIGCEGHAFGPALAQAANLQVGLSAANATFCELPIPFGALDFGVKAGLSIDAEGFVVAPSGPGLGLEADEEALARAVV